MDGVDQLERARAGDPAAFEAIVDLWGDTVFRLAWLLTGDRTEASAATRIALLGAWRELPALHSERAFRPWLLQTVIEAARERTASSPGTLAALADAAEDLRIAAALRFGIGLKLGEIASTMIVPLRIARGSVAEALETLGGPGEDEVRDAVANDLRGIELDGGFFAMALAPRLAREPVATVARAIAADPERIWPAALDPEAIAGLTGYRPATAGPRGARAGDRLRARGRLAGRWRARVELTITRTDEPSLVTWTERARVLTRLGTIELRWRLAIDRGEGDTMLRLALDGIAGPEGLAAPPGDLAERLQPVMHRGLEALAARATL